MPPLARLLALAPSPLLLWPRVGLTVFCFTGSQVSCFAFWWPLHMGPLLPHLVFFKSISSFFSFMLRGSHLSSQLYACSYFLLASSLQGWFLLATVLDLVSGVHSAHSPGGHGPPPCPPQSPLCPPCTGNGSHCHFRPPNLMTISGISSFLFSRAFIPLVYISIREYSNLDGKQHHSSLSSELKISFLYSLQSSWGWGWRKRVSTMS